jgi:flagellar basal-body rod modification protein FlgD
MSAISGFATPNSFSTTNSNAFSELTSGQFLKIIFAELANQDPFEPNDSQAMLQQLATIRSIESDTQLSTKLNALVRQNEFAAATGLIGNLVSGITLDNRRVADLVISVSMTQDGPVLNLFDGSRMFFSKVDEVVGPLNNPPPPNPGNPVDPPNNNEPPPPTGNTNVLPPVVTAPPQPPGQVNPADPGSLGDPKQERLFAPAGR